jgi:hypothetical protein
MVVEKEPKPHQPGVALLRRVRKHKTHGPNDMGSSLQQNLAFYQCFSNQAELEIFQIAQSAVD